MAIDKIKQLDEKIAQLQKEKAIAILEKEIADIKSGKTVPERTVFMERMIIEKQTLPQYPIRPNWYCGDSINDRNIVLCQNGTTHLSLN